MYLETALDGDVTRIDSDASYEAMIVFHDSRSASASRLLTVFEHASLTPSGVLPLSANDAQLAKRDTVDVRVRVTEGHDLYFGVRPFRICL